MTSGARSSPLASVTLNRVPSCASPATSALRRDAANRSGTGHDPAPLVVLPSGELSAQRGEPVVGAAVDRGQQRVSRPRPPAGQPVADHRRGRGARGQRPIQQAAEHGSGSAASRPGSRSSSRQARTLGGWPAGQVFRLYREEIARANAIIAATPLEALARRRDPRWDAWGWPEPEQAVTLRWIILHMIEETARHAGHLDTARELLDGRTGLG